jgi:aspartate kinase
MLEMASLGSKVLQIRSVEFAGKYKVKLRVLSSLRIRWPRRGQSGTLITFEEDIKMEQASSPASRSTATRPRSPSWACRTAPASPTRSWARWRRQHRRRHDHPERRHDGMTDFSFTVPRGEYQPRRWPFSIRSRRTSAPRDPGDNKICKVSVVGVGMRSHVGIASKMFRTLAEEGINIQMISTSEIKISVVIDEKYLELAVRVLHKAFDLDQPG